MLGIKEVWNSMKIAFLSCTLALSGWRFRERKLAAEYIFSFHASIRLL